MGQFFSQHAELSSAVSFNDDYRCALYGDVPALLGLGNVTYIKTFNDYLLSPLGIDHFRQPNRYGDFAYGEPEDMIADYGLDVHPVLHQYVNAKETEAILHDEVADGPNRRIIRQFSPYDIQLGRLVPWHHETDENTSDILRQQGIETVGDIRHGYKTPEDKLKLRKVRNAVQASSAYARFSPTLLSAMNEIIEHYEPEHPVERLQEASHSTGFARIGLQALRIVQTTPEKKQHTDRYKKSLAMAREVLPAAVEKLEKENAIAFVRVARLLDNNHRLIDLASQL